MRLLITIFVGTSMCVAASAIFAQDTPRNIDAVVMHQNGKAYFFVGDKYWRFDFDKGGFDKVARTGHPRWKGVWQDGIEAATEHPNGNVYFFKGGRYQRFDFDKNKVDKEAALPGGWHGLKPERIDAAFWRPDGKAYFLKGDRFERYNFKLNDGKGKIDKVGRIVDEFKGVWADGVDAAVVHPKNGMGYFFKGNKFRRFDFQKDAVDKEGTIGVDGWKALPPEPPKCEVKPFVSFENKRLEVLLTASQMRTCLKKYIEFYVDGDLKSSATKRISIDNYRPRLSNGTITVRFDYKYKQRGFTSLPFGRRLYTPWVEDSGWIESDISVSLSKGRLVGVARSGGVRASSNSEIGRIVLDIVDNDLRAGVADAVNKGIENVFEALGGNDIKELALKWAPDEVRPLIEAIPRDNFGGGVSRDGVIISLQIAP